VGVTSSRSAADALANRWGRLGIVLPLMDVRLLTPTAVEVEG
jgi:hypothetical protein